jgi:hypothetical protein
LEPQLAQVLPKPPLQLLLLSRPGVERLSLRFESALLGTQLADLASEERDGALSVHQLPPLLGELLL